MPWRTEATFSAGSTIAIKSFLSTHHNGHMELRGCPMGSSSTQSCFDKPEHAFIYVKDLLYGMPADPAYPERGYYAGGQASGISNFEMELRVPDALVGSQVLLQYKYVTANSCSPIGYKDYFERFSLPSSFWNSGLGGCSLPYPVSFSCVTSVIDCAMPLTLAHYFTSFYRTTAHGAVYGPRSSRTALKVRNPCREEETVANLRHLSLFAYLSLFSDTIFFFTPLQFRLFLVMELRRKSHLPPILTRMRLLVFVDRRLLQRQPTSLS